MTTLAIAPPPPQRPKDLRGELADLAFDLERRGLFDSAATVHRLAARLADSEGREDTGPSPPLEEQDAPA